MSVGRSVCRNLFLVYYDFLYLFLMIETSFEEKIRDLEVSLGLKLTDLSPLVREARKNILLFIYGTFRDTKSSDNIKIERNILLSLAIGKLFSCMPNVISGKADILSSVPQGDDPSKVLDALYGKVLTNFFQQAHGWAVAIKNPANGKGEDVIIFDRLDSICEAYNYPLDIQQKALYLMKSGMKTATDIFFMKTELIAKLNPGIREDDYLEVLKKSTKLSYQLASLHLGTFTIMTILLEFPGIQSTESFFEKLETKRFGNDSERVVFPVEAFEMRNGELGIRQEIFDTLVILSNEMKGLMYGEKLTTSCPATSSRMMNDKPVMIAFENYLRNNLKSFYMPVYNRAIRQQRGE